MGKRFKLQEVQSNRGDLNQVIPALLEKHNGSQKAVAHELGVAHSTVCLWLRNNGFRQVRRWERVQ